MTTKATRSLYEATSFFGDGVLALWVAMDELRAGGMSSLEIQDTLLAYFTVQGGSVLALQGVDPELLMLTIGQLLRMVKDAPPTEAWSDPNEGPA